MTDLFQNKFRIQSSRIESIDYNNGYFFVTFCTKEREHTLGEIHDGKMNLSTIGEFALKTISEIHIFHPYCMVKSSVIMPNHIHAVLYVAFDITKIPQKIGDNETDIRVNHHMQSIRRKKGKLSDVVGAIKCTIKRFANENDIVFGWQPRYYDHFIRNTEEMEAIKTYIENNVTNWVGDEFYD